MHLDYSYKMFWAKIDFTINKSHRMPKNRKLYSIHSHFPNTFQSHSFILLHFVPMTQWSPRLYLVTFAGESYKFLVELLPVIPIQTAEFRILVRFSRGNRKLVENLKFNLFYVCVDPNVECCPPVYLCFIELSFEAAPGWSNEAMLSSLTYPHSRLIMPSKGRG